MNADPADFRRSSLFDRRKSAGSAFIRGPLLSHSITIFYRKRLFWKCVLTPEAYRKVNQSLFFIFFSFLAFFAFLSLTTTSLLLLTTSLLLPAIVLAPLPLTTSLLSFTCVILVRLGLLLAVV